MDKREKLCIVYTKSQKHTKVNNGTIDHKITQELERTELGDARRTKRLIKIVENLSAPTRGEYSTRWLAIKL
jgi:hypothetical protein